MVAESILELIGSTPLVELSKKVNPTPARVFVKLEAFNPGGSAKDRPALAMVEAAERDGRLKPGGTIIEPTSGNTGVGLALVAAVRGYRMVLVMPDTMSVERRRLAAAYGAEVVLTPGSEGMKGSIAKARELERQIPGAIIPQQFENPSNPDAHYRSTGPEIWRDLGGRVDAFVAGIGTGGTITGAGRFLKERNPAVRLVGVEPDTSPLLSRGTAGPHKLQGIGANFVPGILDRGLLDEIAAVSAEDAGATARALAAKEGLFCGITSGAAAFAALELAARPEFAGRNVVALLPDTGERYLSTWLYANEKA